MRNKTFFIFTFFIQTVFAQNLVIIDRIDESLFNYKQYNDNLPNSFSIIDSSIYIGSLFGTYYKRINDSSNGLNKISLRGENIKSDGNLLANSYLEVNNTTKDEKFEFFDIWSINILTEAINFCISDSIIYFFQQGQEDRNDYYNFKAFNLRSKNYIDTNISHIAKKYKESFTEVLDVYVRNRTLYLTLMLSSDKYMLNCIDYLNDELKNEVTLDNGYDIIGEDIFGNLVLFDNFNLHHKLTFISPSLNTIFSIKVDSLINKMSFMKNNNFFEDRTGLEPYILSSINDNSELIFMVITVNGIYFIKLNYLSYLNKFYTKKSKNELRILRNTIFARKGRIFQSDDLNKYFTKKSWYKINKNYSDSLITDFDKNCIRFIQQLEKKK